MTEFKEWGRMINVKYVALVLGGLGLGYLAGLGSAPSAIVRAEVTEEPRREAFKAGGVMNEPILREIAATLKRIETRVEKIEKNTKSASEKPTSGRTTASDKLPSSKP